MLVMVCLALALALFLIGAFWNAPQPQRVNLVPLGLAFLTIALMLTQGHVAL